jgi:hypothetical protein
MGDVSVGMAGPAGQPDHSGNGRRGVRFDPTINLGHILTAFAFLFSTLAAWFTLNARVDMASQAVVRLEKVIEGKADKETASRGELELSRRIVETQQNQNSALVRIDAGFAELKTMLRDVERKLDTKADKPGR